MKKSTVEAVSCPPAFATFSENSTDSLQLFWNRVRDDEPGARTKLYAQCRKIVYSCCRGLGSARNNEDEICQDVVAKVLKKAENETLPRDERHFCNLLFQMVKYRIRDGNRSLRHREYDNNLGSPTVRNFSDIDDPDDDCRRAPNKPCRSAEEEVAYHKYKMSLRNDSFVEPDEQPCPIVKSLSGERVRQQIAVDTVLKRKSPKVVKAFQLSYSDGVSVQQAATECEMTANHLSKVRGTVTKQILEEYAQIVSVSAEHVDSPIPPPEDLGVASHGDAVG